MSKTKTVPAERAILEALAAVPGATAAQLAVSAGVGRSTASKLLSQLESTGKAHSARGGRDGVRRLPDQWSLPGKQPTTPTRPDSTNDPQPPAGSPAKAPVERLRPGQLDGIVLAYMREQADSQPHGPSSVAKAIERSSGAVGNCLVRLSRTKQVREVSDRPRRYSLLT